MTNEKMSRRKFLKTAGIAAGATIFACSGLTYAGTRQPSVDMYEGHFEKGESMNKKVLVAYASRAGSTSEIAKAIGEELTKAGASVDVLNVKSVKDISGYSAVVIGSAIRMGSWVPEAVSFVENNTAALKAMPTAFFTACLSVTEKDPTKQAEVTTYMDKPKAFLTPTAEATFAGVMDPDKIKWIERQLMKAMKTEVGDFRDWDAINNWAKGLPVKLSLTA